MLENFSYQAVKLIDDAKAIARDLKAIATGSEHLLLAMYQTTDTICHFLLSERLVTYENIVDQLEKMVIMRKVNNNSSFTVKFQEIIVNANKIANKLESEYVYDEHLFYSLLTDNSNVAKDILIKLGLDIEELEADIEDIFNFDDETIKHPFPFLTNISILPKIHPYINRGNHINRIKIIMRKKQKNNPLLIGNAGVGKTAIVEGYAEELKHEVIYRLDLGSMISGTKYRGELEEKIIQAMDFIKEQKAILFIDEIHNIVGSGSNEGSLDIANILKPYLARSDIRCIGATTLDEYYRYIEKDKALLRRFQTIFIDEPTPEETKYILDNIKQSYESFHHVTFSNASIEAIISKANKYLPNRTFPDKAIDIMDEVGAKMTLHLQSGSTKPPLVSDLIDQVVFEMSGISYHTIAEIEAINLNYPELRSKYLDYFTKIEMRKPILVAKLTKQFNLDLLKEDLAKVFNYKEEEYLEIDLDNYQESIMINNLIGATKGYIGYESGGILSEHLIKYPFAFVNLPNLDHAHITIKNFFEKIMNSPFFIDNKGRKINLTNTIIIFSKEEREKGPVGLISDKPEIRQKEPDALILR